MINEKIEKINNLQQLEKYACSKSKYRNEWYLSCVDCKELPKCKAGQRAMVLMDNATKSSSEAQKSPEDKTYQMIIDIFSKEDPIRYLLEISGNIKPQSVYIKVNSWRKNYPDLEAKYHMLEKVRFLWRKPYDSMKVPEILQMMYPDSNESEEEKPYKSGVTLKHENEEISQDTDDMSLEDFLAEQTIDKGEETILKETKQVNSSKDISDMNVLIEKLEKDKADLAAKIQELDKQIEAVRMTMELMNAMAQKG